MDLWSKVDYSEIIRAASMVMEKLTEVNPPSGRVPGRSLLALPILEARRRRNRGEIAKNGSVLRGFASRGINRGKEGSQSGHQVSRRPLGAAPPQVVPPGLLGTRWGPSGPPSGLWKLPLR